MRTVVIIPAYNEEAALPEVLRDLPAAHVDEVLVVDNASTDGTADAARRHGARVVQESRRGYGSACLAGLAAAADLSPDIIVFLDADHSDFPEDLPEVVRPIREDGYDLVIGSRMRGQRQRGALLPQARFGNLLAVNLIRLLYGHRYTDLGPFRAVRWSALQRIAMQDTAFGWTVEMQIRALQENLRVAEVPVRYRKRVGTSKITGTLRGTLLAGHAILTTIFRLYLSPP